jgi:hypothetical protein
MPALSPQRVVVVCAAVLWSCAEGEQTTSQRAVRGPSGGLAWAIQCEQRSDCFAKAGRLCKHGYRLLDSSSQVTGATTTGVGAFRSTDVESQNDVLVECKE